MKPTAAKIEETASRYLKIVEWSDEDKCFVGRCPGLFFGGCHGSDEVKVYAELSEIVREVVADMLAAGEPLPEATAGRTFSGKFFVRTSPEIHQKLVARAESRHESLNRYVNEVLAAA
jgi:predicted HicB family RNase H-like nuclease